MTDLAQYNLVLIAIAVLVGFVVAFWLFRWGKGGKVAPRPEPEALRDITGETPGPDTHVALPEADGPPDNLQTMKGVGPRLAAQLNEAGVTRFDQLAALDAEQAAALDARMGAFQGRLARDRLVEQAAYLARGDTDGFEATFGRLGGA
jgi:predicted flap endonuclease-1-like 5' DNA nuclease